MKGSLQQSYSAFTFSSRLTRTHLCLLRHALPLCRLAGLVMEGEKTSDIDVIPVVSITVYYLRESLSEEQGGLTRVADNDGSG